MAILSPASPSQSPRLTTRLTALVSDDESAIISRKATALGLSVSAYLRDRALSEDSDEMVEVDRLLSEMEASLDGATAELSAILARIA